MNFFVRAQGWVLFTIVFFGLLILSVGLALMGAGLGKAILTVLIFVIAVQALWLSAIGRFLYPRVPKPADGVSLIYLAAAGSVAVAIVNAVLVYNDALPPQYANLPKLLNGLVGACLLIASGIVSRQLKAIELGRPMSPGTGYDYLLSFFFMPIGMWIIQSRINRMYQGKTIDDADDPGFWEEEI